MTSVEADRDVPALIVKIGDYPIHSGGVGAVRSLGRLGIPVYVITEDLFTPLSSSRYSAGRFTWRTTGAEDPDALVSGLAEMGRRIGRRAVAIPTDDEAAILLAEHADELSTYFLCPAVQPGLPRQLASKHELFLLCREHDVPAPSTALVSSIVQLADYAEQARYPIVAKNPEPWRRLTDPVVGSTHLLRSRQELLELARARRGEFRLLVQEYIPPDQAEDWIVHLYCDANSACLVRFTGIKVRSWPPDAGPTACAYAVPNPTLADLAQRFCKAIGFQGIADLDWRLDRRDGCYKLVDFNPRVGNQFPLFRTPEGVDVVSALHLDLTGRNVPASDQVDGRRIVVEHIDVFARHAYRTTKPSVRGSDVGATATVTEYAWAAWDDPLPLLAVCLRLALRLVRRLLRRVVSR